MATIIARAEITLSFERDISATYRFYKLQSSTSAAPSKPISIETLPPSGWSNSEPSYTEGSTNSLYTVDLTVFTDGTFSYSDVSLSSAYEASKQAYNKAVVAQNTANATDDKINAAGSTGTNLLQDVYAPTLTKVNAPWNRYFSNSQNSTTTCEFVEATNEVLPDPNAKYFVRIKNTEMNMGRGLAFYLGSSYENVVGFVKGETYKASCWMRQLSGSSNAGIAWYNATQYTDKNFVPSDKWERYELFFTYGDYNETIQTYATRIFFNNMAGDAINGAGTGIGQIDMCGFRVEHVNTFKNAGRNLCLRSKTYQGWNKNSGTTFVSDSTTDKIVFPTVTTAGGREAWQKNNVPYSIVRNQKVVVTCKVKGEVVNGVGNWIAINICPSVVPDETSDNRLKYQNKHITLRANGEWQTICTSMYVNDSLFNSGSGTPDYDNCYFHIRVGARNDSTYGMNGFEVKEIMVALGSEPCVWSEAPEDVASYTDAAKAELNLKIESNTSRVATLERSNESITSRVSSAESNITSLTTSFNNLEIGGRNLLRGSETMESWYTASSTSIANGVATLTGRSSNWSATVGTAKYDASLYDGTTTYTWSFEYCSTTDCSITAVIAGTAQTIDSALWTRTKYANWRNAFTLPSTNGEWSKHVLNSRTIALSNLTSGSGDVVSGFLQLYARTDNAVVQIRHMKLEKGNKSTDWTPAPEDIKSEVVSLETRVSTAESKITDSAIVNTVRTSTNYQNDLSGITAKMTAAGMTGTNLLEDVYAPSLTKVNAEYNRYFSDVGYTTTTCEFVEPSGEYLPDSSATHFVRITSTELNKPRAICFYQSPNYTNYIGMVVGETYRASCWVRQLTGDSTFAINLGGLNTTQYRDQTIVPTSKWTRYDKVFTFSDFPSETSTTWAKLYFYNMSGNASNGASTGIGQIDMCGFRLEAISSFKSAGRNLCLRSKSYQGWGTNNGTTFVSDVKTDKIVFPTVETATWREAWQKNNVPYSVVRDKPVTVTFKVKGEVVDGVGNWIRVFVCLGLVADETSDSRLKYVNKYHCVRATGDWQDIAMSIYVNDYTFATGSGSPDYNNCYFNVRIGAVSDSYGLNGFEVKELMVALGSEPCVWSEAPEDLEASIDSDVGSLAGNIARLSTDLNTKIDHTQTSILSTVSESYYLKTDANNYISSQVSTSIKQLKDSVQIDFEKVQSSLTTIDGKVSANQVNLEKYIRFVDGSIVLGNTDSSTQLKIENDKMVFSNKLSGDEIASFRTDGLMVPTGSSIILGNYQFVPRENGSLDFKKVG